MWGWLGLRGSKVGMKQTWKLMVLCEELGYSLFMHAFVHPITH